MIRLFKHYISTAVAALAAVEFLVLLLSAELGRILRAWPMGDTAEPVVEHIPQTLAFAVVGYLAMAGVGINDANRPVIASVSSTHFDIVNSGSIGLDIAGSGFRDDQSRGTDEASTGDYASSATNYPVVRIRRIGCSGDVRSM